MFSVLLSATTTVTETDNIDAITNVGEMTDGVTNIAKAISEYGPLVVLMAVFLVIFLALVVLVLRSNSKMMTQIMNRQRTSDELDQKIINKFVENALATQKTNHDTEVKELVEEIKEAIKLRDASEEHRDPNTDNSNNDYHKDLVGAYIDVNMAFKDASRSALNALHCDRIAIYVFHNGNKSMHGLPFFKMSCVHEWTTHGSNTLRGKSHTDMPLHLFNDFIENLWKCGVYKAEDVQKSIHEDPSLKEFIAFSNTESLYMVSIKDDEGALSGFVVAEFEQIEHFECDDRRDTQIRHIIDTMIDRVGPIVTHQYIYRRKEEH